MKPLIFVHPLSDTLKKLHEVMEETAQSEGIELYEIDDIREFNQLFPTIGQSVAIFGDPKKCAKGLQSNKKVIQKLHSKVILLSSKAIPKKTLEKFDKVGLTECIIEPVVPKTLLYKVKLHLRSIITKEEQEEQTKSFSKSDNKNETQDQDYNTKKFSSQEEKNEDEEGLDYRSKSKKVSDDDDSLADKSSYHEDGIDTHWKGKNTVLDESAWEDEDEKKKGNYQEQSIDGFYKGKVSKKDQSLFEDDDLYSKEKKQVYLEDEISDLKKNLLLEVEEDIAQKASENIYQEEEIEERKTKSSPLEIEDEKTKDPSTQNVEKIDSYLKGKSTLTQQEESLAAADGARDHLKNDPMTGAISDQYLEQEDGYERAKGSTSLDILAEEKKERPSTKADQLSDKMTHDGQVIHEDQGDDLSSHKKRKTEEIEKYIKGSLSHQKADQDQDDIIDNESDLILDPIDEEDVIKRTDLNLATNPTDAKMSERNEDLSPEEDSTNGHHQDLDVEKTESQRKSDYKEKDAAATQTGNAQTDIINNDQTSRSQFEEGDLNKNYEHQSTDTEDKNLDHGHLTGEAQREHEKKKKSNLADNRADKIQKHYKGRGNSHQQQGWGNLHQKEDGILTDFEKNADSQQEHSQQDWESDADELQYGQEGNKKNAGEFIQNQKEKGNSGELIYKETSLGEQTIDYKKLKEEFDAIPYDLKDKGNKYGSYDPTKKESGYNFESSSGSKINKQDIDPSSSTHLSNADFLDLPPDLIAKKLEEKNQLEDEDVLENEDDQIFEPRPQGLQDVIKIAQSYLMEQENFRTRLVLAAENIKKQYQGQVSFYLKKPGTQFFEEVFVSYFDLSSNSNTEYIIQSWNSLKEIKFPFWLQMTLPTWSDTTFQDRDCDYFFPFTENQLKLGFAVVHFTDGFNPEKCSHLEVYLDALRGIFMEPHQQELLQATTTPQKKESKEPKGLLGRFFKDKAS